MSQFSMNERIRFKSRVGDKEAPFHDQEATITHLPDGKGSGGHLYYIKFDDDTEIGVRESELESLG